MNMSDRIQYLRKSKGISQEELADKIGVSRQAVSKWESEQSSPDLEKIITMSELFDVTTDYILKGIEPVVDKDQRGNKFASQVLFISSTAFVFIGLFCAFGGWHDKQTMDTVWGSMIIQAVGVAGYFIGKLISTEKPSFYVKWLNLMGVAFIPISMITGYISILLFKKGWVAPYPNGLAHSLVFGVILIAVAVVCFIVLKKGRK